MHNSGAIAKHTTGLGTTVYAAPEQRNEFHRAYDHRVDIYSLGVILFELFYVVVTEMERVHLIAAIKEQKRLPENFTSRWSKLGDLILRLTSHSAEARPKCVSQISTLLKHSFDHPDEPWPSEAVVAAESVAPEVHQSFSCTTAMDIDTAITTTTTTSRTVEREVITEFSSSTSSLHHETQVLHENEQLKRLITEKDKRITELEQMVEHLQLQLKSESTESRYCATN